MNDLTRWNRTGLTRFDYVDGNAATFLERLRATMIVNYLRGIDPNDAERNPDFWFDLLADAGHPAPNAARAARLAAALDWSALANGLANTEETKIIRNTRLVANYAALSDDYAAEMMRAFARAVHVLGGYVDAYMNESYLATATQWNSLQKLGEMVNYIPVPAASAATTVALIVKEDIGKVEIDAGLAMSATPPDGGAPLIFETLEAVTAHPDLNAVRQRRWNVNRRVISMSNFNPWLLEGEDSPTPGAPVVIVPRKMTEPSAKALTVVRTEVDKDADTVRIKLAGTAKGTWRTGYTELWCNPDKVVTGLAVSTQGQTVVQVDGAQLRKGAIVQVEMADGQHDIRIVATVLDDGYGLMGGSLDREDVVSLWPLSEYPVDESYFETPLDVTQVYFNVNGSVEELNLGPEKFTDANLVTTGQRISNDGESVANRYRVPAGATVAGALFSGEKFVTAKVVTDPPKVTQILSNPKTTIGFSGKPPKTLAEGDYFVARAGDDKPIALRVRGVRVEDGAYYVAFNQAPPDQDNPEKTLFFGPMKTRLRLQDHDRSQASILDADGTVMLAGLSDEAKALIRVGDRVIIEDKRETGVSPILATVDEIGIGSKYTGFEEGERDQAKIRFTGVASDYSDFVSGYTVFRFNTALAGHGESKGGKTLGSGNGEKPRQTLPLDVKNISFIADSRSATGVRPDIEVLVDDVGWDYADLTDATAEDTASYSVRPLDDDTLQIVFRRRLPTGSNNLRVSRHRVGSGARGSALAAKTFTKPKSKHRHVEGIVQPFATSGGADREPTDAIRENAGASIAANNRAVSLQDFTRLVRRQAAVWDAHARQILHPGRGEVVDITVVPANDAPLTDSLRTALERFVIDRALPGTAVVFNKFDRLPFTIEATLRVDEAQFIAEDVADAAQGALKAAFGLTARRLDDPLYVAEVLSALEGVTGAETAQVTIAVKSGTTTEPGQVFTSTTGAVRAIYPRVTQVVFLEAATDITIGTEALS